jgi:hypothetical protein
MSKPAQAQKGNMPELPDVEVFRRYLDETALHQPIDRVDVFAKDVLGGLSQRHLQSPIQLAPVILGAALKCWPQAQRGEIVTRAAK